MGKSQTLPGHIDLAIAWPIRQGLGLRMSHEDITHSSKALFYQN